MASGGLLTAEGFLVKETLTAAAGILSKPYLKPMQHFLLGEPPLTLPHDGETVGAGCAAKASGGSGTLPACPDGTPHLRGSLTYINGINTGYATGDERPFTQDGICKTMQALANATCAEVIGVYNATGGTRADVGECLTNIAKSSFAPSVKTLKRIILDALEADPPQDVSLYAHSQGGLVTQEALADVKNDLEAERSPREAEELMGHISVRSFGTAEAGWPAGPKYEQFTNTADSVPGVIAGAQRSYPTQTFADSAAIAEESKHYFNEPFLNPLSSHSMDNVYIKKMLEINGTPKCCG